MRIHVRTMLWTTLLGAVVLGAPAEAWAQLSAADSTALVRRGAEVYSRECQRCHVPRSPSEFGDREWVIVVQHMQTRAVMTRSQARAALAFLLASNRAARQPGTRRPGLPVPTALDVTEPMIDAGRALFGGGGGCAACHGADLGGGPIAPSLRDAQWKNGDGSMEAILRVIRNGVEATAMAAYPGGITDEEAIRVAAYVWAVAQGRAEP